MNTAPYLAPVIVIAWLSGGSLLSTAQAAEVTSGPTISLVFYIGKLPAPEVTAADASGRAPRVKLERSASRRTTASAWRVCLMHAWESKCARYA
jgi:hypothetical protein